MSLLSRLFGGASPPPEPESQTYEGFRITPAPVKESGGYRIAARIEKEIDGVTCVHEMIRADTYSDPDTASDAAVSKARQVIDFEGERLFR